MSRVIFVLVFISFSLLLAVPAEAISLTNWKGHERGFKLDELLSRGSVFRTQVIETPTNRESLILAELARNPQGVPPDVVQKMKNGTYSWSFTRDLLVIASLKGDVFNRLRIQTPGTEESEPVLLLNPPIIVEGGQIDSYSTELPGRFALEVRSEFNVVIDPVHNPNGMMFSISWKGDDADIEVRGTSNDVLIKFPNYQTKIAVKVMPTEY